MRTNYVHMQRTRIIPLFPRIFCDFNLKAERYTFPVKAPLASPGH